MNSAHPIATAYLTRRIRAGYPEPGFSVYPTVLRQEAIGRHECDAVASLPDAKD